MFESAPESGSSIQSAQKGRTGFLPLADPIGDRGFAATKSAADAENRQMLHLMGMIDLSPVHTKKLGNGIGTKNQILRDLWVVMHGLSP